MRFFTPGTLLSLLAVLAIACFQVILPFVVLLAYAASMQGRALRAFFCHPLVYTLGGMCYTIYLYHFFVISAIGRFALAPVTAVADGLTARLVLLALVLVPIIAASCAVLFALAERPFMVRDWPRKAWQLVSRGTG